MPTESAGMVLRAYRATDRQRRTVAAVAAGASALALTVLLLRGSPVVVLIGSAVFVAAVSGLVYREFSRTATVVAGDGLVVTIGGDSVVHPWERILDVRVGADPADRSQEVAVLFTSGPSTSGQDGIDAHVLPYLDAASLDGGDGLTAEIEALRAHWRASRGDRWLARHDEIDRRMPELERQMDARRQARGRRGLLLAAGGAVAFVVFLLLTGLLIG